MKTQEYLKRDERWVVAANKEGIISIWPKSLYNTKNHLLLGIFNKLYEAQEYLDAGEAEKAYDLLKQ